MKKAPKPETTFSVRMWNKGDPLGSEQVVEVRARHFDEAEELAEDENPGFDRYDAESLDGDRYV